MVRKALVSITLGAALALLGTASASATTFCVPGYFADCPNSGGNIATSDVQSAVASNGSDGIPDKVIIDAFTYVDPDTLHPNGSDPLEIDGAGTSKTVLTTSSTGNVYVVDTGFGDRLLTIKDLTIRVPESVTGASAALYMIDGNLENVDIETRHDQTEAAVNVGGGLNYEDGHIYATGAGTFTDAVKTFPVEPGAINLDEVTIDNTDRALLASSEDQPVTFTRGRIRGGENSVFVFQGGRASFVNSIIEGGSNSTFGLLSGTAAATRLNVESSTIVGGSDPTRPAIVGQVVNAVNHESVRVNVSNSILRGFDKSYELQAPTNQGSIGNAYISFDHSNFNLFGTHQGDGSAYIAPDNINEDPLFATDNFTLSKNSPSIDAGDPVADEPSIDFLGSIRPIDGDDDGTAIRDQGAYEFVPDQKGPPPTCETDPTLCPDPPTCETDPTLCPKPVDKTAPKIIRVKFRQGKTAKKASTIKLSLSEAARIKATFKPTPARPKKGQAKRKTVKLSVIGKKGAQTLKVKKGKLKPGRYKLTITAADTAGNRSKTVTRKVKVKPV